MRVYNILLPAREGLRQPLIKATQMVRTSWVPRLMVGLVMICSRLDPRRNGNDNTTENMQKRLFAADFFPCVFGLMATVYEEGY